MSSSTQTLPVGLFDLGGEKEGENGSTRAPWKATDVSSHNKFAFDLTYLDGSPCCQLDGKGWKGELSCEQSRHVECWVQSTAWLGWLYQLHRQLGEHQAHYLRYLTVALLLQLLVVRPSTLLLWAL